MIFSITKFNNLKQYVQFNIIFSNFKLQNILTLVDQHHLDNRVQRNVHLVRAHAIHATMRRAIVSVAELFRWNVVQLRDHRGRRRHIRDFIDQRNQMITTGSGQESVVGVGNEKLLGSIEIEAERQEDLDVGSFDQHTLVAFLGVFQIADTNRVRSFAVAHSVQWIHDLRFALGEKWVGG